ncbi:MAG: NADH-quinone oxidoreductase subunit NuoE [Bacteroidota bacterium]
MRVARVQKQKTASFNEVPDLELLNPLITKYKGRKGNLIPLLQGAQQLYGFIPKEAFIKISDEAGLRLSDMYGVATFYSQFRLKPVGKNIIKVCHGTACHVQNANAITDAIQDSLNIKDTETTEDRLFTLESVACLGCCSLAPVMMIGDNTYGKLTGKEAVKIIKEIRISNSQPAEIQVNTND